MSVHNVRAIHPIVTEIFQLRPKRWTNRLTLDWKCTCLYEVIEGTVLLPVGLFCLAEVLGFRISKVLHVYYRDALLHEPSAGKKGEE